MDIARSFVQSRIDGGFTADWVPKTNWDQASRWSAIHYMCKGLGITVEELKRPNQIKTVARSKCGKECFVVVKYDEHYRNFEYVSFDQVTHDGTIYFSEDIKLKLACKPMMMATSNNTKHELIKDLFSDDCPFNYNIEYIVGPIFEHTEYGHFNNRGWLEARTTVAMPIAMNIIKVAPNN